MCVIDDHAERLALRHRFKAAGHRSQELDATSNGLLWYAESGRYSDRRADIKKVELAHERRAHLQLTYGRFVSNVSSFPAELIAYRNDIGCNLHSIANHSRRVDRTQVLVLGIVRIQNHHSRRDSIEAFK